MSLETDTQKSDKTGKVYLVGAGPSDVELITVKGKRLLEEAEVIVYDRLVGNGILMWGSRHARYIDVGKRSGHHPIPQEEINQILVREARKGQKVVRLKGGDPLVFGRGGEEAAALKKAGIPFEIVPGITSAIGVPSYLGIPVTHRDMASSVHIVTAHKKDGSLPDIHYRSLAEGGGTIVFLMGVSTIGNVMAGLLEEGMAPDMPAAVLERGTTSAQRKIIGTVGDIAQKAVREQVQSPAIILGWGMYLLFRTWTGMEIVRWREKRSWSQDPGSAVCALPPCSGRRGRRCWSFPRSALRQWRTGKACPGRWTGSETFPGSSLPAPPVCGSFGKNLGREGRTCAAWLILRLQS